MGNKSRARAIAPYSQENGTGNRVEDTRFPVTANGLSRRDAVPLQRKFG